MNKEPQETHPERPSQAPMDSLMPTEMALKAERVGELKAGLDIPRLFALAVLAGFWRHVRDRHRRWRR